MMTIVRAVFATILLATAPVSSAQTEEARLHDLASKGNASALEQLKALANNGNLEAAFQLSILYSAGQGVRTIRISL